MPAVGANDRAFGDAVFHKSRQTICFPAWDNAQAEPARINKLLEGDASIVVLPIFCRAALRIFPLADFHRADDGGHIVNAAASSMPMAADEAFIHFHRVFPADTVPRRADHPGAQFMEDLEGGFIARQAKLALKLKGGLAWGLGRYQVGCPKPYGKWGMGGPHDRRGGQRGIAPAFAAAQHDRGSRGEAVWLILVAAIRAGKAIRPSQSLQVLCASGIVWKDVLKLRQSSRESAWVHNSKNLKT